VPCQAFCPEASAEREEAVSAREAKTEADRLRRLREHESAQAMRDERREAGLLKRQQRQAAVAAPPPPPAQPPSVSEADAGDLIAGPSPSSGTERSLEHTALFHSDGRPRSPRQTGSPSAPSPPGLIQGDAGPGSGPGPGTAASYEGGSRTVPSSGESVGGLGGGGGSVLRRPWLEYGRASAWHVETGIRVVGDGSCQAAGGRLEVVDLEEEEW
jgi:hypothetical protein